MAKQQAPQQQQPQEQAAAAPLARTDAHQQTGAQVLPAMLDRMTEYTPFMQTAPLKLSVRTVLEYLCTPTRTGQLCSERDAMKFIMLCKARGLNPWEGDAFIIGYDGKDGPVFSLVTSHQAVLKRAEVHPEYDGMESGVIVRRDGKVIDVPGDLVEEDTDFILGGWAKVYFKNRKYPMHKRLKLATFSSGRSRWQVDPAGMIVKCAEADALRSSFPNSLGGMYLDDEMPEPEARRNPPIEGPPVGVNVDMRPSRKIMAPSGEVDEAPPGSSDAPALPKAPAVDANGEDAMARNDALEDYKSKLAEITDPKEATPILAQAFKQASWLGKDVVEQLTKFSEAKIAELKKKPAGQKQLGEWSN